MLLHVHSTRLPPAYKLHQRLWCRQHAQRPAGSLVLQTVLQANVVVGQVGARRKLQSRPGYSSPHLLRAKARERARCDASVRRGPRKVLHAARMRAQLQPRVQTLLFRARIAAAAAAREARLHKALDLIIRDRRCVLHLRHAAVTLPEVRKSTAATEQGAVGAQAPTQRRCAARRVERRRLCPPQCTGTVTTTDGAAWGE